MKNQKSKFRKKQKQKPKINQTRIPTKIQISKKLHKN